MADIIPFPKQPSQDTNTSADLSTLELKAPSRSIYRWPRVAYFERQEKALVRELGLDRNVTDTEYFTGFSAGCTESPQDRLRNTLIMKRLNNIIAAKERYYGSASPETVDSLIYTARFCYQRENDFSPLDRKEGLYLGNSYFTKAIALVDAGLVDLKDLHAYTHESKLEQEIGSRFEGLFAINNQPSLRSLALQIERAHGSQLCYSASDAIENYSAILELFPTSQQKPRIGTETNEAHLEVTISSEATSHVGLKLEAALLLERSQQMLRELLATTEGHAFAFGTIKTFRGTGYYSPDTEAAHTKMYRKYIDNREQFCSACVTDFETISRTEKTVGLSPDRSFKLKVLQATRLFLDGSFEEAVLETIALRETRVPSDVSGLVKDFGHRFGNIGLRFKQQEWLQSAEAAYLMSLELEALIHGRDSVQTASNYADLGHFYFGASGYHERFLAPTFGQGDPNRLLDASHLELARDAFEKARDLYHNNTKEGEPDRWNITHMQSKIDKIDELLKAASPTTKNDRLTN